ncbi:MAG: D-allulose-6-phosphate 3-epimerase [Rhizobiales bacterium]|nr:D-allulose-6-phosphate 3-epimerase [Hyphomicrobiales bacterium]
MVSSSFGIASLPRGRLLAEMSLWSADLARMAEDMKRIDPYTDIYHLDAADGHFSPAFLLFPDLVAAIRRNTTRPLHVHLMVEDAILLDQVKQFAEAGASIISVHAENANADEALALIGSLGLVPGIVLQLHTPAGAAKIYLERIGVLTFLGTRIGVKGQSLDSSATARLREARIMIDGKGPKHRILLAADGGIRENTVPDLYASGADTVVMGSLALNAPDLAARMAWVRAHAGRAQ